MHSTTQSALNPPVEEVSDQVTPMPVAAKSSVSVYDNVPGADVVKDVVVDPIAKSPMVADEPSILVVVTTNVSPCANSYVGKFKSGPPA